MPVSFYYLCCYVVINLFQCQRLILNQKQPLAISSNFKFALHFNSPSLGQSSVDAADLGTASLEMELRAWERFAAWYARTCTTSLSLSCPKTLAFVDIPSLRPHHRRLIMRLIMSLVNHCSQKYSYRRDNHVPALTVYCPNRAAIMGALPTKRRPGRMVPIAGSRTRTSSILV